MPAPASASITNRHQFKRWLLWYLELPEGATYKEIQAALLRRLEGQQ